MRGGCGGGGPGRVPGVGVGLADEEVRAALRLVVDAPDVFADDAEQHHLHAGERGDGDEQGDVSGSFHAVDERVTDDPRGVRQRDGEEKEAEVEGGPEWFVVEGDDAVESVVEEFPEGPFGTPLFAHRVLVGEGLGRISDPGENAFGEAVVLGEAEHGVDRPPGEQPEVADAVDEFHVDKSIHEAVVGTGGQGAGDAVARPGAAGDDLVVSPYVQGDHAGDELGRVLEVGVHDDDRVAARVPQAGEHGRLLAEVAAEGDVPGAGVVTREGPEMAERFVTAAIVHVHEFKRDLEGKGGRERGDFPGHVRVESAHDFRLVETGHDEGDEHVPWERGQMTFSQESDDGERAVRLTESQGGGERAGGVFTVEPC
ncbi:hypothetical protein GCM10018987_31540 [Streptomyces cremeus]